MQTMLPETASKLACGVGKPVLPDIVTQVLCVQGKLMTSWAVVCDVYFLEPQKKGEDESAQQFAERVQRLIAERAKLQIAPWDGYLKYYTLGVKVCALRAARLPGTGHLCGTGWGGLLHLTPLL